MEVLHGDNHEPWDPGVSGGCNLVDLEDPKEPGAGETGMRTLCLALRRSLAPLRFPSPLCLSSPSFLSLF